MDMQSLLNIRLKFLLSFIKWSVKPFLLILIIKTLAKKRKSMKYSCYIFSSDMMRCKMNS